MRTRQSVFAAIIALMLVVAVSITFAQGEETLTGCLEKLTDGTFVLGKKGSTEKVKLHATTDLAAHVGHTVRVTGQWQEGDDGAKVFHVSKMEHVDASCGS